MRTILPWKRTGTPQLQDLNRRGRAIARRRGAGGPQSTCIFRALQRRCCMPPSRTRTALPINPRDVMPTRLNITYSAYRELETIPQHPLRDIGEAIIALAEDPHPPGSALLKGIGGCYYLAIDDYYILYHVDEEDGLTVLGVLHGPYHPLH